jgi:hypothetical protein
MDWRSEATREALAVLKRTARQRATITYSDLVAEIHAIPLEPDSKVLAEILDKISTDSDAQGKGMLSAVVVHKDSDDLPGPGFFALAKKLGRDTSDKLAFHSAEIHRVHRSMRP